MSTLLVNGCSFVECWQVTDYFQKKLNCNQTVNLGKSGTSFQRTVRSTVEWIAQNGNPNCVILPITFLHRWELSIGKKEDPIDGTWYPLQNFDFVKENLTDLVGADKVESLLKNYYSVIPDIRTHWDKGFTEIILLSSFLEQRKIKYLMFDMCNNFDEKHLAGYKGFTKLNLIKENKNIIDLFSFCGNRFMWNTLNDEEKQKIDPLAHHHNGTQYRYLENHLLNYL